MDTAAVTATNHSAVGMHHLLIIVAIQQLEEKAGRKIVCSIQKHIMILQRC